MSETAIHEPGPDWTCSCGYDYFGGSAAYSWQLFAAHLRGVPRGGSSCLCRDPLREVHAGCPIHGHSPERFIPPGSDGAA